MIQENEKKLSVNQLDDVAGGTTSEVADLGKLRNYIEQRAIERLGQEGWNKWNLEKMGGNFLSADAVDFFAPLGIEANISRGFLGIGSVNNTYRDKETGQMILHSEVVEYIKTGVRTWRQ